jgi:hypothetical protein
MDTLEKVRTALEPLVSRGVVTRIEGGGVTSYAGALPAALVRVILSENEPHRAEVDRLLDAAGIDRGVVSVMLGSESTD